MLLGAVQALLEWRQPKVYFVAQQKSDTSKASFWDFYCNSWATLAKKSIKYEKTLEINF